MKDYGGIMNGVAVPRLYNIPDNSSLLNWRYDPYSLLESGNAWGSQVYDPVWDIWRLFYSYTAGSGTETIRQKSSANNQFFGNDVLALGHGGVGTFDAKRTAIPYVWYEAGEARPWRMLYFGQPATGAGAICLATSVDAPSALAAIPWERKDAAGNALSAPVLSCSANIGDWDYSDSIDFSSIIKVGNTYYCYYNTITVSNRKIGLATSTDLVTWTKHAANPFYTGVTDYDDLAHDGTPDLTAGFFCADTVYWPLSNGTPRYVQFVTHYTHNAANTAYDVYSSSSPIFTKANRTYVGKVFDNTAASYILQGNAITVCDVPKIITDDISRNVATSIRTGNNVILLASVTAAVIGAAQVPLIHHKSLNGAILSNVSADLPVAAPAYALSPTGGTNTKFLLLPGQTGTLRDLSGNNNHLMPGIINCIPGPTRIDASGIFFESAKTQASTYIGIPAVINNITSGDFTVRARASVTADYTGPRTILDFSSSLSSIHFWLYLTGAAGPLYTLNFRITSDGGTLRTASVAFGAVVPGQLYRIAVTKTGGKVYLFKDGALLNAGGTAFNYTIDSTPTAKLNIGASTNNLYNWDGYIDEVAIDDTALWTANYTPAALTFARQASGNIYLPPYDLGATNTRSGLLTPLSTANPAGCAINPKVRAAANLADQSSTAGDFSDCPATAIKGQYQQYGLNLTGDGAATPSVDDLRLLLRNVQ